MSDPSPTDNQHVAAVPERNRSSIARYAIDSVVCLALSVIMFRNFLFEVRMVSTGSMAPHLLGYHQQVECPSCHFAFAVGSAFDESVAKFQQLISPPAVFAQESNASNGGSTADDTPINAEVSQKQETEISTNAKTRAKRTAVCPNCGQQGIDITNVPINQGDQILIHKDAYQFVAPKRWNMVVFRNPQKLSEAYVKRVVGLSGETIKVRNGNVIIDGEIARKNLEQQRALRINVFDFAYDPVNDPWWEPRWTTTPGSGWIKSYAGVRYKKPTDANKDEYAWLTYRNWIRSGGSHRTYVPLPENFPHENLAILRSSPIRHEAEKQQVSCRGALSFDWHERLVSQNSDPQFAELVKSLYRASHVAPVYDFCSYNSVSGGFPDHEVADLMLAARIHLRSKQGKLVLRMQDHEHLADCVFDVKERQVQLFVDGDTTVVGEATLSEETLADAFDVEMSLFDRQITVAINGKVLFTPWVYSNKEKRPDDLPRRPIRIGVKNLELSIETLQVFRDVYYTAKSGDREYQIPEGEYFMLGDNSPVSFDSRSWRKATVPKKLFLGKPLFVHLPSTQENIDIGGKSRNIRIPDFSRIRYIR